MTAPAPGNRNPNFPPSTPEVNNDDKDPFEFLSPDNLQAMRDEQHRALTDAQSSLSVYDRTDPAKLRAAEAAAKDRFEEIRQEYIHSFKGIDENHPEYDNFMHVLHEVSVSTGRTTDGSVEGMTDSQWIDGVRDNDGNVVEPSGRSSVEEYHDYLVEQKEAQDKSNEADPADPADPLNLTPLPPLPNFGTETQQLFTPEQLQQHIDRVDAAAEVRREAYDNLLDARDKLAQLTVKRQGRHNDKVTGEYREAFRQYEEAKVAYAKAGEAMLDVRNTEPRDETTKRAAVVEFLLYEAAELRKITNEKWDNTTVNKVCRWMARGNLAQRILKGAVIGGGVAAATALVTAATAGTGAVGAVAGGVAAVTAASRGMRAYGAVRGKEVANGNQDTTMTGTGMDARTSLEGHRAEIKALIDRYGADENGLRIGSLKMNEHHEKAITAEQKKNRKALYVGMGSVALGSGIALALSEGMDYAVDYADRLHGSFDSMIGDPNPNATPEAAPEVPAEKDTGGSGEKPGGTEGDQTGPSLKELGEKYTIMADIDKGMGGEQLFSELGVDPDKWYQHEDALLRAHPNDFYRMDDGHVGIAHSGKLSDAAMLDIATRTGLIK